MRRKTMQPRLVRPRLAHPALSFFKGVQSGMKLFGECTSALVNAILLSVVYLVGIGLSRLLAPRSHREMMEPPSKRSRSYWRSMRAEKRSLDEHYRQF
jgi:hypothetical protein